MNRIGGDDDERAEAKSTEVKAEFLMTYFTPYERYSVDGSLIVANVKPGGWVRGPKISGKVIPPGGDWLRILPSGAIRLDVRLLLETDDGAHIYMSYNGVGELSKDNLDALGRGEILTDKTIAYFVTAPTFQTSSEKHGWLNKVQAVGKLVEFQRGEAPYMKYNVFIIR